MAERNQEKDMTEKTLETFGDVYADLMNVLIFGDDRLSRKRNWSRRLNAQYIKWQEE